MAEKRVRRRLAAILAADVVGYSRLMGEDDKGTLTALKKLRAELIDPNISGYGGRTVKLMGDGALVEFPSVVDAVECALSIQHRMVEINTNIPVNKQIAFRIGVNLGDVIIDGEDIYGDGVNIAARLEGLAEPGGVCVSETVFAEVRNKVDASFKDLGLKEFKNIAAPMRVFCAAIAGPPASMGRDAPSQTQASIAVLPFDNMSGDPDQEYFSDGITEDVITNLSKISGLFVVARNSTFVYKGHPTDVRVVAGDLGVRYIMEGSVRKVGDRLRITAQLVDSRTGYHLWAEHYDRNLTDIFALQDEITEKIVEALEIRLTESDQERAAFRYTKNLEAYDLFLRGREQSLATNETNAQARELFERAIEFDPGFSAAYAFLSYTHYRDWYNQWSEGPEALERAFEAAQKAVSLDDSLALAHAYLAWIYVSKKQHKRAIEEAKRAVDLDPNFAEGYARFGEILTLSGRPRDGLNFLKKAMRLDPHYPPHYLVFLGDAYYAMGNYDAAIAVLRRCLTRAPNFLTPHRTLAVIYSELGRTEDAGMEIERMLRISPHVSLEGQKVRMYFEDAGMLTRHLDGLRKAGLPE